MSVDSVFCHAAWGESLGGLSIPLLSDFHPKGEVARQLGLYLEDKGITDRATVVIDAGGTVRQVESVGPGGVRDMDELLAFCRGLDAEYEGPREAVEPKPGLPDDAILYVKEPCTFSRWALAARMNLRLAEKLPVKNVTVDASAREELAARGGKDQAPALFAEDDVRYESAEIIDYLVERCAPD